jgi:hypothetical protein
MLFRKEHPEYTLINSELKMTSEKYKCNGTLDCLAKEEGKSVILDWKSSDAKDKDIPAIYDEYLYQVAAYVKFYEEIMNVNINKAVIVSIAKDKVAYNYRVMEEKEIKDCFEKVFLPALSIYNYQQKAKWGGWA